MNLCPHKLSVSLNLFLFRFAHLFVQSILCFPWVQVVLVLLFVLASRSNLSILLNHDLLSALGAHLDRNLQYDPAIIKQFQSYQIYPFFRQLSFFLSRWFCSSCLLLDQAVLEDLFLQRFRHHQQLLFPHNRPFHLLAQRHHVRLARLFHLKSK